jgi:hypothetical protein
MTSQAVKLYNGATHQFTKEFFPTQNHGILLAKIIFGIGVLPTLRLGQIVVSVRCVWEP